MHSFTIVSLVDMASFLVVLVRLALIKQMVELIEVELFVALVELGRFGLVLWAVALVVLVFQLVSCCLTVLVTEITFLGNSLLQMPLAWFLMAQTTSF